MNYVITALIAISSLLGGYIVHEQSTPNVGASQSISSLTELTSLSHNDVLPITEANGLTTKKVKWGTATSSMKAVFDPLYSPIFSTSAGLAGLLSDETGSSGGFVRAGSPTITSPVISSLSSLSVGSDATGDIYYRNGSGNFVRLAMPSGSGYYLTGSSTLSIPQWDNNILTNPYSGAMVFNGTTTFNATSTFNGPIVGSVNVQTFTSSSTWYKPSQTSSSSSVFVECWGAGGAGAGSDSTNNRGGGGGGGAYLSKKFIASELSSTVTVTIGSGGLGVLDGSGNAGGNTTFGSYLTSYGGGGGGKGTSGGGGGGGGVLGVGGNSTSNTGAAGGGPNGGAANGSADFGGGGGGTAAGGGLSSYGGGGGGSVTSGGGSVYGGGGGGGGQTATQTSGGSSVFGGAGGASGNDANGSNGSVPGGGGGGTYSSASNYTGGNGANGKCIVTTHI